MPDDGLAVSICIENSMIKTKCIYFSMCDEYSQYTSYFIEGIIIDSRFSKSKQAATLPKPQKKISLSTFHCKPFHPPPSPPPPTAPAASETHDWEEPLAFSL